MKKRHGKILVLAALCVAGLAASACAVTPKEAWNKLMQGNRRYRSGNLNHPRQSGQRRSDLAKSQAPFAVILSCSDSRVPPEVIFDQGLGDLFVIRVAGNITDPIVLGSIEYAVEHLHSPLVVVMGHERCGAVKATVAAWSEKAEGHAHAGEEPSPNIMALIHGLMPAVEMARTNAGDDLVAKTVEVNVKKTMHVLKMEDEVLAEAVEKGKLRIRGAVYDLDSGEVEEVRQGDSGE